VEFTLYVILLFLTFGLSALGIITSYRLKGNPSLVFASSLFYWSFFMVSFGYYGIWGMVFFKYLATPPIIISDFARNLISVIPAFGSPLLLVSWFLLIRFAFEYSDRNFPRLLTVLYFAISIPSLAAFLYLIKIKLPVQEFDINQLYKIVLFMHFAVTLAVSFLLIFRSSARRKKLSPITLSFSILIPAILMITSYEFRPSHWLITQLFIFCYFLTPAFLPSIIYFKIGDFELRKEKNNSFDEFCTRYEISKREAEIIEQICKGKPNKEIAESLFISLQTVKDHASRIYLKTGVANRVQLTNLVRSFLKS